MNSYSNRKIGTILLISVLVCIPHSLRYSYLGPSLLLFLFLLIDRFLRLGLSSIILIASSFSVPFVLGGYPEEIKDSILRYYTPFQFFSCSLLHWTFLRNSRFIYRKRIVPREMFVIIFLLFVICFLQNLLLQNNELVYYYYVVGYTIMGYCYFVTHPIPYRDFLFYIKIIFFCSILYALLEMQLAYVPFCKGYISHSSIESVGRYSGALGNSLIFVGMGGIMSFMFTLNYLKRKNLDYVLFILSLICILLSSSRTGVIVLGFSLFLIICSLYRKSDIKNLFLILFVATISVAFLVYNYSDQISFMLKRMSSMESGHRFGSYDISWTVFQNNIMGYGGGVFDEIQNNNYHTMTGFVKTFETFDNTLLSLLTRFGIFLFLPISLYSFILRLRKRNRKFYLIFLCAPLLLSFSFNIELYMCLNLLFFSTVAFWELDC